MFANVPTIWAARKPIAVRSENGVVQERDMLCLTEQGVYFFLGRSDKPKALPYQMWIAGDVVPSIHATGSYSVRSDNHTLDIQLKTIDIERAKILQHIAAAPELYEVFRRVLEEIPIIAGDSRHDALSYAISDARQLLERIDREEDFA